MNIVHQVFLAIEGEGKLSVGENILLATLDRDEDLFEKKGSWRSFIYGTFGDGRGSYYLGKEPTEYMLKKYCPPLKDYKHLFVQHIGGGNYVPVAPEHLKFEFDCDANCFRKGDTDLPSMVTFYVKATLKE